MNKELIESTMHGVFRQKYLELLDSAPEFGKLLDAARTQNQPANEVNREAIARLSQLRDELYYSVFVMGAVRKVYSKLEPIGFKLREDLDSILLELDRLRKNRKSPCCEHMAERMRQKLPKRKPWSRCEIGDSNCQLLRPQRPMPLLNWRVIMYDELKKEDLVWLLSQKMVAHSGEGTMERHDREAWNARIDRLFNATRAQRQPTSGDDREEIARIIDPDAFERWDRLRLYWVRKGDTDAEARASADWAHGSAKESALAKADAILAQQGPGPGEAVAWRTCGMSGDRWTPWEMCSEERAKRWMLDPSFKNGRRKVEPLYAATPTREA